jgi:hypothetical protein
MNTLLLIILLQIPIGTIEQNSKWEHISYISIGLLNIAQFADLSTTMYMSGKGGFKEANPILRPYFDKPIRMALIKGGLTTLSSYLLIRLHKKHPKLVTFISTILASGIGYIAYQNSKLEQSK